LGLAASRRRPAQLNDGLAGAPRRGQSPSEHLAEVLPRAWVEYPICSVGMGMAAGPELAAASNTGGFGVLGTHDLSAEVIQPAKQPNFGHLADVLREAQSEPSRHRSPMPSASGDGSLGEIVDTVREHTRREHVRKSAVLPPVWRRLVFQPWGGRVLGPRDGCRGERWRGRDAAAGPLVVSAENPRSCWLRGRQAHRTEPKRGTT
jgi:hypothetical protein